MNQPFLADVQIPGPRPALPLILNPVRDIILKIIQAGVIFLTHIPNFQINLLLTLKQRLQLAVAVVNNPHRRREPQLNGPLRHHNRILRIMNSAAYDRIDIHVEIGMLREHP